MLTNARSRAKISPREVDFANFALVCGDQGKGDAVRGHNTPAEGVRADDLPSSSPPSSPSSSSLRICSISASLSAWRRSCFWKASMISLRKLRRTVWLQRQCKCPRQESNLVFDLRRVACESGTPRGQCQVPRRGVEPRLQTSLPCTSQQSQPVQESNLVRSFGSCRAIRHTHGP